MLPKNYSSVTLISCFCLGGCGGGTGGAVCCINVRWEALPLASDSISRILPVSDSSTKYSAPFSPLCRLNPRNLQTTWHTLLMHSGQLSKQFIFISDTAYRHQHILGCILVSLPESLCLGVSTEAYRKGRCVCWEIFLLTGPTNVVIRCLVHQHSDQPGHFISRCYVSAVGIAHELWFLNQLLG